MPPFCSIKPQKELYTVPIKAESCTVHSGKRVPLLAETWYRYSGICTLGPKLGTRSNEVVAAQVGDSKTQVQRYIRLTELVPDLLDLVDNGRVSFRPAVELSYLTRDEQQTVYDQIIYNECLPSHAQAIRMRKLSKDRMLTEAVIIKIMKEEKPNQVDKIHIPYSEI